MQVEWKHESSSWEINHPFDTASVSTKCWVYLSGELTRIFPLETLRELNKVTLTFTKPYSGIVEIADDRRWDER